MSTGSAIEGVIKAHEKPEHGLPREKSERVYVASSWRNNMQTAVVAAIRAAGMEAYDFKNPPGRTGFHWSSVMPSYNHETCNMYEYITALQDPISAAGFRSDMDAMEWADTIVCVLPCGRSAHLELGWGIGAGKRTAILLDLTGDHDEVTPELMYLAADYIAPSLFNLLGWLGVED